MVYKQLGFGLGVFSIALGLTELLAGRRLAKALDAEEASGIVRAFGAREMVAGAGLLANPAHATLVWGRVAGDAADLAALGLALGKAPRNRFAWGALASVAAVTVIDIVTALGLDRTTGKTLPDDAGRAARGEATTSEPDRVATPRAPDVPARLLVAQ